MHQLLPEVVNIFQRWSISTEEFTENNKSIHYNWNQFINYAEELDRSIEIQKRKIVSELSENVKERIEHAISTKKNNDRALNVYIGALAVRYDATKNIDVLTALELIDSSILIMDDLYDNAEYRAKSPAFHKMWGENLTNVFSDLLKSLGTMIIARSRLPNDTIIKIIDEIESYYYAVNIGQYYDLVYESKSMDEISIDDYLNMIKLTTGSQVGGGFKIGAMLEDINNPLIQVLGQVGNNIGILGQIRDDIVDYINDEEQIYKSSLLDFKNFRKRLPLIIGWNNANSEEKNTLNSMFGKDEINNDDYFSIVKIIMKQDNLVIIKNIMESIINDTKLLIDNSDITDEGKNIIKGYLSYGMGK